MGQKKLVRFAAIETYPNVLQYPKDMPGNWKEHFGNNNPITLELACGKGEYSLGLSAENPDRNYIGVDIKGNRIYIGAKKALAEKRENVAFLRVQIGHLEEYFAPGEVDEIWILFPDPFLRKGKAKEPTYPCPVFSPVRESFKERKHYPPENRLAGTIRLYKRNNCGTGLHLCCTIGPTSMRPARRPACLAIQTFYEKSHLADGRKIYYLSFQLPTDGVKVPERFAGDEAEDEYEDQTDAAAE